MPVLQPTPAHTHGAVAVYGANGHTGRFILDELARRGIPAVAAGRTLAGPVDVPARVAGLDDPAALARAFAGCRVVINAAGPFLDTAAPIAAAALAAGCHYLDLTAEQESARATLSDFDRPAQAQGLAVIPAAAFYGGLAGILAAALAAEAVPVDAITTAIALDRWWPTAGTRLTGARNTFPRLVVEEGRLTPAPAPGGMTMWDFGPRPPLPSPLLEMEPVPLSEVITLSHHLRARRIVTWLNTAALRDLRNPDTPAPAPADAQGRSAQRFTLQVVLDDARGSHRATAWGRDIYAVSAPLVVEAAARLLADGPIRTGAGTLGSAFDPHSLLAALAPACFNVALEPAVQGQTAGQGGAEGLRTGAPA